MALSAGTRLGPYEVLGLLGAGGMGEVYRARDPRLGREVAVKVLPEEMSQDRERLRRFEREARAAGSLNHPSILDVHDIGEHEGRRYVVTERLEGETLRAALRTGGITVRKAVDYAVQVARGLAAAHEKGIVHRDLKPENLFLTGDGRIKILDFGLAKLRGPAGQALGSGRQGETVSRATDPGAVMGTAGYMSPEQIRGQEVDQRSDIFAFGTVLYEMLAGRRPFVGETGAEVMTRILRTDPPPLGGLDEGVGPGLEGIVRRCLQKRRDERFQLARDLAFALEVVAAGATGPAPSGPDGVETRAASGRRTVRVALIVVAVLAVVAAAYLAGRRSHRPPVPSYQQLTFRRGAVHGARFAPDGQTVVYAASWSGGGPELFSTRIGSTESRPLGVTGRLLSISRRGDIAVKLGASPGADVTSGLGTLARVSLAGGAMRELLHDVRYAAWDVAGRELAVLRRADGRMRLEYPIGRPVYEPAGLVLFLRFLPDESLVFFERQGDGLFSLMRVDRQGEISSLTTGWVEPCGLGPWSEATGEVWFAGASESHYDYCALHAVTLSGRERLVARLPGGFGLRDVDPSGRVLLGRGFGRRGIVCLVPGESRERDLSWLGGSQSPVLSADGRTIVFTDLAAGVGALVYLRSTDGSPAVRLGEGGALSLSPDGRWVLAGPNGPDDHLLLLPTGPGEPRRLQHPSIRRYFDARWFPDGQRILVVGGEAESRARLYTWDWERGTPRPVSPEMKKPEQHGDVAVSPDGAWVAAAGPGTPLMLYPTEGGEARSIPGHEADDRPRGWSADGRWLVVRRAGTWLPMRIDRLDVRTGERQQWKQVAPDDPTGVIMSWGFTPTPDGRGYAYSYMSSLSTLYLVEGLE